MNETFSTPPGDAESGISQYGETMLGWAKELFPICRSITGEGLRHTIDFIRQIHPETDVHSFATGEKVFDWDIPREWAIRDAYIEHESGKRFAEFKVSNLHVVGYSAPLERTMSRDELLDMIWTQPDQPDRIPYITSYYTERSGFCMSQNDKEKLPPGHYRVLIDSELKAGELNLAELVLPGETDEEVLFSTYICHPSMANNELSGPVLAIALADYLKRAWPNRSFGYRFLFVPETIGSISYLSRNLARLKEKVRAGYVLSCVGDERAYSHVMSRLGDTLADRALAAALAGRAEVKTYSFLKRGSDERQYCAPGIDLPVCGFCRSKYGEYPEYHTDADNFDLVTANGLQGAFDVMRTLIDAFETGVHPRTTVLGEPQLGKRGLYPTISQKGSYNAVALRMNVLAYCDGATDIFTIAGRIGAPLADVVAEIGLLKSHGLIA